jgi:hypothetical protein
MKECACERLLDIEACGVMAGLVPAATIFFGR